MATKSLVENMIGKPFHPREIQGRTPAFVRKATDITAKTTRRSDGVQIAVVMAVQGGHDRVTGNDVLFGICLNDDDIAVRRTAEELVSRRKIDGAPCFTEAEGFGFSRTYGIAVEDYREIAISFLNEMPEIKGLNA